MGFLDSLWTHIHSEQQNLFEAKPKTIAKQDTAPPPKVSFAQALQTQVRHPLPPNKPAPLRPETVHVPPAPPKPNTPTTEVRPYTQPLPTKLALPFKTNESPVPTEPLSSSASPLTLANPNRMTGFIQPALPFASSVANPFELQAAPYQLTLNFVQQGLLFAEFQSDATLPLNLNTQLVQTRFSTMAFLQQEVSLTFGFSTDTTPVDTFHADSQAPLQDGSVEDTLAAQFAAWWGALQSVLTPTQPFFSWSAEEEQPIQSDGTLPMGTESTRVDFSSDAKPAILLPQLPFASQASPALTAKPFAALLPEASLVPASDPLTYRQSWTQPSLAALDFATLPTRLPLSLGTTLPQTIEPLKTEPENSELKATPTHPGQKKALSHATGATFAQPQHRLLAPQVRLETLLAAEPQMDTVVFQVQTLSFATTLPAPLTQQGTPKLAPLLHQILIGFQPRQWLQTQNEVAPLAAPPPTAIPPVTTFQLPEQSQEQSDSSPEQGSAPLETFTAKPAVQPQPGFNPEIAEVMAQPAETRAPVKAEPAVTTPTPLPLNSALEQVPTPVLEDKSAPTVPQPRPPVTEPDAPPPTQLGQPSPIAAPNPMPADSAQQPVQVNQAAPKALPGSPANTPVSVSEVPEPPAQVLPSSQVAATAPQPSFVAQPRLEPEIETQNEASPIAANEITESTITATPTRQQPATANQPQITATPAPQVSPRELPEQPKPGNNKPQYSLTEQVRMNTAQTALDTSPTDHTEVESAAPTIRPTPAKRSELPLPQKTIDRPQPVAEAPAPEAPMINLNPAVNPHLSASQVIQAINEGVYFADIPRVLQEIIQTAQPQPGVLQSINVTLRPEHLGEITANFVLHENKAVTITLLTQTQTAQKTLQNYINEIHQVMAASNYKVQTLQIAAAAPSQQQQQSHSGRDGQARQASDWRRPNNRRRKANDNMTIDVTI